MPPPPPGARLPPPGTGTRPTPPHLPRAWSPAAAVRPGPAARGPRSVLQELAPASAETLACAACPAAAGPAPVAPSLPRTPGARPLAPGTHPAAAARPAGPRSLTSLGSSSGLPSAPLDLRRRLREASGTPAASGAARGARAERSRETAPPGRAGRSGLAAAAAAAADLALSPAPPALRPGRRPRDRCGAVGPAVRPASPLHLAVCAGTQRTRDAARLPGPVQRRGFEALGDPLNKTAFKRTHCISDLRTHKNSYKGADFLCKVNCSTVLSWKVGNFLDNCPTPKSLLLILGVQPPT